MRPTPDLPATRPANIESQSFPTGETAPIPVTTTRRGSGVIRAALPRPVSGGPDGGLRTWLVGDLSEPASFYRSTPPGQVVSERGPGRSSFQDAPPGRADQALGRESGTDRYAADSWTEGRFPPVFLEGGLRFGASEAARSVLSRAPSGRTLPRIHNAGDGGEFARFIAFRKGARALALAQRRTEDSNGGVQIQNAGGLAATSSTPRRPGIFL